MGNRAAIAFSDKKTDTGIYLHWNGGVESILGFLKAAEILGIGGAYEDYYKARFTQMIGNFFGGTSSIGLQKVEEIDGSDNGTFYLDKNKIIKRSRKGILTYDNLTDEGKEYADNVCEQAVGANIRHFIMDNYDVRKSLETFANGALYVSGVSNYENISITHDGHDFNFLILSTMFGDKKMATVFFVNKEGEIQEESAFGIEVKQLKPISVAEEVQA